MEGRQKSKGVFENGGEGASSPVLREPGWGAACTETEGHKQGTEALLLPGILHVTLTLGPLGLQGQEAIPQFSRGNSNHPSLWK